MNRLFTGFILMALSLCAMAANFVEALPLQSSMTQWPTYFQYTEEDIAPLKRLRSSDKMNFDQVEYWDEAAFQLILKNKQGEQAARIYAYLDVAQRDAAFLSYDVKRRFEGSLDPISQRVLALFFPSLAQEPIFQSDAYSNALAEIVLAKIKARLEEDEKGIKDYGQKEGPDVWQSPNSKNYGLATGSWKPWFLTSSSEFRLPAPPPPSSPEWNNQLKQLKAFMAQAGDYEKNRIYYWAGKGEGEDLKNGDWRKIAMDYMQQHHVSFPTMLLVRSNLSMTMEDASIAAFDSKYTYWVKRPAMLDPEIKVVLPAPNHPSYPSGHSTISAASATVLAYFFPRDQEMWRQLAEEAGMSRIWCGIHFPLDHETGLRLGRQVGQAAVQKINQSH